MPILSSRFGLVIVVALGVARICHAGQPQACKACPKQAGPSPCSAEERSPDTCLVQVDALCVKVPREFLAKVGLAGDTATGGAQDSNAWVLTARESKMFATLLRAQRDKDVISNPSLMMRNGQEGCVFSGQAIPFDQLGSSARKTSENNVALEHLDVGMKIKVTPAVSADGKQVCLAIHASCTSLVTSPRTEEESSPISPASVQRRPALHSQTVQAKVCLPNGGTTVLACPAEGHVSLWVLTARLVEPEAKAVTFVLKHTSASDVAKALSAAFAKVGNGLTIVAEPTTNKLVVRAGSALLGRIARVVEALDAPAE